MRTELDITGRPAQLGRGIMAEVGDRIVRQFASHFEELLRNPVSVSDPVPQPGARPAVGREPEAVDLGPAALLVLLKELSSPRRRSC
ncbi:hypothetical protein [Streptomyces sp. NPDC048419]|uniref:hypothetical protein n=1 Tax=Streptomyces sp. NPDC048419 TaxID=3365547 RepID=UPI00371F3933